MRSSLEEKRTEGNSAALVVRRDIPTTTSSLENEVHRFLPLFSLIAQPDSAALKHPRVESCFL
jgi:hypothetical protein